MRRAGAVLLALVGLAAAAPAVQAEPERDWTQRALALQYELASDMPLRNAPWVYTHNAFNSRAEMGPTLSTEDQNQKLSLVDQLNEGVRHLEIDEHLFLGRPTVCHAAELHVGCSIEKPLLTVLREVRAWSDAHPSQVLWLYLESHLDTQAGYDLGAAAVSSALGDLLVRPPGGGSRCAPLPLSLSRDAIRRAGKRILLMGPCGIGTGWEKWVFDESLRVTGHSNAAFESFPGCGPDFKRSTYQAKVIRYYEDSTQLTKATNGGKTDPVTVPITTRMIRCGVDLIGFDQLDRGDPRLTASVWSWGEGEPRAAAAGSCSAQGSDSRWRAVPCSGRHRAACRDAKGHFRVSVRAGKAVSAPRLCGPKRRFVVPRTGYEGQLLRLAKHRDQAPGDVWLAYRRAGSGWRRAEKAGCGPSLRRPRRRVRVRRGIASFVPRLGFACTGERLSRRISVRGAGGLSLRVRSGHRVRVPVSGRARRVKLRYRYHGRLHRATVRLRRG